MKGDKQVEKQHFLTGELVAVPENRQLDILVNLLESRGARVLRLPLVSILDAPDPEPIEAWLTEIIAAPCKYFIILTGEGVRRLSGFAERAGCAMAFQQALARMQTICRGPKPGRALHELGLKPDIQAAAPTTQGVISTLESLPVDGARVAVQLYGEDPNTILMEYLASRNAEILTVAPYVYADASAEEKVLGFIARLQGNEISSMVFTSQPQYKRLYSVAVKHGLEQILHEGLRRLTLVAVGPVVARQLEQAGLPVAVMPETSFFMKPMVTALVNKRRGMACE
ncbi:MAG: uroporphyrinogen-III synthase [Pseudomonadales bacterium]|nr:uroporphyrinogen-III synthase [Pseudomonadales bacterium]